MRELIRKRAASFGYAFKGIATLVRTQTHAKIHLVATLCVVVLGALLRVASWEWIDLVLAITIVWTAEGLNTALEFLADEVSLEKRPGIGHAKDIGAAAVLIAAIGAAIIGCIVFVPHLVKFFY
jgi:diacylglycerol kinase